MLRGEGVDLGAEIGEAGTRVGRHDGGLIGGCGVSCGCGGCGEIDETDEIGISGLVVRNLNSVMLICWLTFTVDRMCYFKKPFGRRKPLNNERAINVFQSYNDFYACFQVCF